VCLSVVHPDPDRADIAARRHHKAVAAGASLARRAMMSMRLSRIHAPPSTSDLHLAGLVIVLAHADEVPC
jgi:hypothetical protein